MFAQSPCDSTPANCAWDLRSPIFSDIGAIEYPDEVHYGIHSSTWKDVEYAADFATCNVSISDQCHQGNDDVNNDGGNFDDSALKYFVYYPKDHKYDPNNGGCKLPAIILFHGGGYSECGTINGGDIKFICKEFAKRGFVAFDVEYRRGTLLDNVELPPADYVCVQRLLAVYRAAQDARGAVRSIIKRELNETSGDNWQDPYRIDVDKIFMGGASAGSVLSLLTSYYTNQTLINLAFPSGINSTDVLGPVDADYYYGDPTINYKSKIKGVLNMWGQVMIPPSATAPDLSMSGTLNLPPMISFQGWHDDIFPPNDDQIYYSPNETFPHNHLPFNTTNNCLLSTNNFSIDGDAGTPDKTGWGTLSFSAYLAGKGVAVERYIDCEGDHGLEKKGDPTDETARNYGTTWIHTVNDAQTYIAQRAATFFQAVLNGYASSLHDVNFIECENYRHGGDSDCNLGDDNDGCANTDNTDKCN